MLQNIWKSREIRTNTKLRIFNSNVKSVLLYGSETWRTTKSSQKSIQTFLNNCYRKIFRIHWPETISNKDLLQRAKEEPITDQITRRKWGWIGHTLRKDKNSITRQALKWNPQGKRHQGRPRMTWRRTMHEEMAKYGATWGEMEKAAQTRVRWRSVVDGLCTAGCDGPK